MLNDLRVNMKKIHMARNVGVVPKNDDFVDERRNVDQLWDLVEPNVSDTNEMQCSENEGSSCLLENAHNGLIIPEYIKRFLANMNRKDAEITRLREVAISVTREFALEDGPSSSLELESQKSVKATASKDDVELLSGHDVMVLDEEPSGRDELEDNEELEVNRLTADYSSLPAVQQSQDEEASCADRGKLVGVCRVCGDHATGMYFGALVCVPCKTFFLRYASDGNSFVCKASGNCQISTATRTQCKYCRYQKCVQAGMRRRVRPAQVKLNEGQQLCVVCSDVGNGVHFGALTCEGCKKFFRRGLTENGQYTCKSNNNCIINPQTRNSCRFCRYQKCLQAGMCREAIQMGRPSKIPSGSNSSRNATDWHMMLCPSSRNADSSSKEGNVAAMERIQAENLSQNVNLQRSDNWMSMTVFGHSSLNPKSSRSLSLSSEESQLDVGNSEDQCQVKGTSSHQSSSISDLTQQPDSTVLSPAEASLTDEQEEAFLALDNNSSYQGKTLKAKGVFSSLNDVKNNQGRRSAPFESEGSQEVQDKKRRMSSAEVEGCSSRLPDRLPMRLHNGGKIVASNNGNLLLEAKRQKVSWALLSQGMLTNSMILPLLKENGSNIRSSDRIVRSQGSAEYSVSEQASGSCSSPSITSSLSTDIFQKEANQEEVISSAVNQVLTANGTPQEVSVSKKFDIEALVALSRTYWLQPCLPDPNILFAGAKHWDVLNSIVPAYDRFLQMSNTINRTLKAEFEEWSQQVTDPVDNQVFLSEWIKHKVIPAYTIASVTYCKSLPGFSSFHCDDQRTIIRLGQSPSRILMAALNWYDADQKNFRNFLSWRDKKVGQLDLFKQKLIEYAEDITSLEVDAIEAALLNVLLILATDYPDLVRADVINDARWKILSTFRAYTTGKCGTPNNRVESLFSHIPELRRLGLLHHMMMTTRTMTAEEVEYLTSGRILDSKMVLSCQQSTDS